MSGALPAFAGFRPPPTGAWRDALKPNIDRFSLAATLGMSAAWNAEGSQAMAALLKHICGVMDDGVAATAYARAIDQGLAALLAAGDAAVTAQAAGDPQALEAALADLASALSAFRHFASHVSAQEALAQASQAFHDGAQG